MPQLAANPRRGKHRVVKQASRGLGISMLIAWLMSACVVQGARGDVQHCSSCGGQVKGVHHGGTIGRGVLLSRSLLCLGGVFLASLAGGGGRLFDPGSDVDYAPSPIVRTSRRGKRGKRRRAGKHEAIRVSHTYRGAGIVLMMIAFSIMTGCIGTMGVHTLCNWRSSDYISGGGRGRGRELVPAPQHHGYACLVSNLSRIAPSSCTVQLDWLREIAPSVGCGVQMRRCREGEPPSTTPSNCGMLMDLRHDDALRVGCGWRNRYYWCGGDVRGGTADSNGDRHSGDKLVGISYCSHYTHIVNNLPRIAPSSCAVQLDWLREIALCVGCGDQMRRCREDEPPSTAPPNCGMLTHLRHDVAPCDGCGWRNRYYWFERAVCGRGVRRRGVSNVSTMRGASNVLAQARGPRTQRAVSRAGADGSSRDRKRGEGGRVRGNATRGFLCGTAMSDYSDYINSDGATPQILQVRRAMVSLLEYRSTGSQLAGSPLQAKRASRACSFVVSRCGERRGSHGTSHASAVGKLFKGVLDEGGHVRGNVARGALQGLSSHLHGVFGGGIGNRAAIPHAPILCPNTLRVDASKPREPRSRCGGLSLRIAAHPEELAAGRVNAATSLAGCLPASLRLRDRHFCFCLKVAAYLAWLVIGHATVPRAAPVLYVVEEVTSGARQSSQRAIVTVTSARWIGRARFPRANKRDLGGEYMQHQVHYRDADRAYGNADECCYWGVSMDGGALAPRSNGTVALLLHSSVIARLNVDLDADRVARNVAGFKGHAPPPPTHPPTHLRKPR